MPPHGSSAAWASVPNCISYDPTFGFELAVIMQDGMRRMVQEQEDVFYYVTLQNEAYPMPPVPRGEPASIQCTSVRVCATVIERVPWNVP